MSNDPGSSGETPATEPNAYAAPTPEADAPAAPVPPADASYSAPPAPSGYEAVPQAPASNVPVPPAYGAPAAPVYGAPAAPGYGQQPTQPFGAQPPAAQAYGAQPYGAQPPAGQPYGGAPQAPQYGAQPQYGTPYGAAAGGYQQQYAGAPKTDGLAIASLVTSLLGFSAIGLGLGIGALRRIKRTGAGGRGLAIAGIVIGAVSIVAVLVFVLFTVVLGASGAFDDIETVDTGTSTWDDGTDTTDDTAGDTADGSTDGDVYMDLDDTVLPDYSLVTGLQVGTCLMYAGTYDLSGSEQVDCSEVHDMEIVSLIEMSGPVELSLSAPDAAWQQASTACESQVEDAAPGLQDSNGWAELYYPHPDQYAAGITTAYCTFTSSGTDLTGSIAAGTLSLTSSGA